MVDHCMDFDCDCCHNDLTLDKLCVKKVKAHKICVKKLVLEDEFCAKEVSTPFVCATQVTANKVDADSECVRFLNASDICNQNLTSSNAQIVNLVANNVCIPGPLKVADLQNCGKYRASATNSADKSYNLGDPIEWDLITDNPNGNMTLLPAMYTVPLSGYYTVTLQVKQKDLVPVPPAPILGNPVSYLEIFVNGIRRRLNIVPFLTFVNEQGAALSAMLRLNAGDIVTSRYTINSIDSTTGAVSVTGSVTLEASGNDTESLFMISLLSVDCGSETPVPPCSPAVACAPCTPATCVPCDPSMQHCDSDRMCEQPTPGSTSQPKAAAPAAPEPSAAPQAPASDKSSPARWRK